MSRQRWLGVFCLVGSAVMFTTAQAASVRIHGMAGAFTLDVKSPKEKRWDTVVRQQYDYSCGSAAVATLLTYHYDLPIKEAEVFEIMFREGDQERIRAQGFSMLDMKRFLDWKGLQSDGFRISLDKLAELGVPGIALVNTNGYRHFVVIKGVKDNQVLIGDPAVGSVVLPRETFEKIWSGVVLAGRGKVQIAREYFNNPQEWSIRPKAPLEEGVDRTGLGMFTLTLPGRNEFGVR